MIAPLLAAVLASATAPPTGHALQGIVRHARTREPLPNALVILQCTCLTGMREQITNEHGLYRFRDLPRGTYTVQVLAGEANVSKIVQLGER
jgi:hypothetical protein